MSKPCKFTEIELDKIVRHLETYENTEYILAQLSDNPNYFTEGVEKKVPKKYRNKNFPISDVHTLGGFLYVTFYNVRAKQGQHNIPKRDDFINYFAENKQFKKMWKIYKKSNFNRSLKPYLNIVYPKAKKCKFITYGEYMGKANKNKSKPVEKLGVSKEGQIVVLATYPSINATAKEEGVTLVKVRAHIKKYKLGNLGAEYREAVR